MSEALPRPPIVHELKIWPTYFDAILRGDKTHEIRNADRDFRVGDTLRLNEFYPADERFSGRSIDVEVSYLTDESSPHGVPGRVLMSIRLKLPTYHEMVEAIVGLQKDIAERDAQIARLRAELDEHKECMGRKEVEALLATKLPCGHPEACAIMHDPQGARMSCGWCEEKKKLRIAQDIIRAEIGRSLTGIGGASVADMQKAVQ